MHACMHAHAHTNTHRRKHTQTHTQYSLVVHDISSLKIDSYVAS